MAEPWVLKRLGLRYTVVLGAFLMLLGNSIKSVEGPFNLVVGFVCVGLSQPLFQCTPALVSANWFSQSERTMATGVMLNANQIGIGASYFLSNCFVYSVDDIMPWFRFLNAISA